MLLAGQSSEGQGLKTCATVFFLSASCGVVTSLVRRPLFGRSGICNNGPAASVRVPKFTAVTRRREIEAKVFSGWWRLATSRCTAVSGMGSELLIET